MGVAEEVLAASLEAQGEDHQALEEYHKMVVDGGAKYPRVLVPYAQLLLKSGKWAEAVAVYNFDPGKPKPGSDLPDWAEGRFSPDVPKPRAFAVALHIARGQIYSNTPDWAGERQNTEAMAEYEKALALEPDSARANFFYGFGWKRLSPDERGKYGTEQQAKAALLKAVRIGKGDVKKAAEKELRVAMNPSRPPK